MTDPPATTEQDQQRWVLVYEDEGDVKVLMLSLAQLRVVLVDSVGVDTIGSVAQAAMRDPANVLNVVAFPKVVEALESLLRGADAVDARWTPTNDRGCVGSARRERARAALALVHPEGAET